MAVDVISFSAHCDFTQTSDFIERLQPPNIVLVHGDQNEMAKLQKELNERYRERINVLSPRNCQPVQFQFVTERVTRVLGQLAAVCGEDEVLPAQLELEAPMIVGGEERKEEDVVKKEMKNNYVEINGIFMTHDFEHLILQEEEVNNFTSLNKRRLTQTQYIPFSYGYTVLK